jgi:hypothetical protein
MTRADWCVTGSPVEEDAAPHGPRHAVVVGSSRSAAVATAWWVAVAAAGLSACGSGAEASSAFCKSVDSLDSAVTQIAADPLAKNTMPAVQASLDKIDSAVQTLSENVDSEFATEVDAVTADTETLDQSVAAASTSPTPSSVNAAREAMRSLTASMDELAKSTSSSC